MVPRTGPLALLLVSAAVLAGAVVYLGPAFVETTGLGDGQASTSPRIEFAAADDRAGLVYSSDRTKDEFLITDAGAYVTDYDGDGWPDVLAVGGEEPVLFENAGGAFERADVLPPVEGTVNAAHFLDYDADGDDDLLLLVRSRHPILLENAGGAFERVDAGLERIDLSEPTGAASADYDGDGCLDLFVFQNGDWGEGFPGTAENRRAVLDGSARPNVTDGNPNVLLRGTCAGFVNVTESAGVRGRQWTLAASFVDLTGDGRPDVHVANDFSHDVLYANRGDGTFERVDLGPATDRNAMSSEIADVNGDARPDIFVTNIYFTESMHIVHQGGGRESSLEMSSLSLNPEGNNLLVNLPGAKFDDHAPQYGLAKGGWGWAASIADFDNDGHLDVIQATSSDIPIVEYSIFGYHHPQVWEGTADGFERRNASGAGFAETNGRGLARLDYDRDGDLDLVVATAPEVRDPSRDTPFVLYENVGAGPRSLSLRVERDGVTSIGAKVYVETDSSTSVRILDSESDFLSQEPRTLHVGLGDQTVERVRVVWPDGTERTFTDLPDARLVRITPDGVEPVEFEGT